MRRLFALALLMVLPFAPRPVHAGAAADALLTLADLPPGYTVSAPRNTPQAPSNPEAFCGVSGSRPGGNTVLDEAEASFDRGFLGPFVVHSVALVETAPEGITAGLRSVWEGCEWDDVDADGRRSHWRLTEISFPTMGDESVAFRAMIDALDLPITVAADIVVIRRGHALSVLIHMVAGFGSASVDSETTARLATIAAGRLNAISDPS